jgi:hypothetical protein
MKWLKAIFSGVKAVVFGGTGLTTKLVIDVLTAIIGKVAWTIVLERLLTRVLVGCLKWLATLTTNQVVNDTVKDIVIQLRSKGLAKAEAEV